ncbi:2'-5' RNA ligase family protein [Rhodococcus erythropolis]|uniref:2'-5' RNA ligase family protein n=1 Tax=Rhodococcus erythropolis TaxID=1833 RepID=UPI00366B72BC
MTAPTTPAGDMPLPTGWRGPVLPLNTPSGDMRQFMLADGAEPAVRPLPVALSAQDEMWEAHQGSRVVGLVTRAWVQDGHLWAEGPLDLEDEFGAEYARKLGDGFAGWVSADLSDISLEEIPLRSDKSEWAPDELAAAYAAFESGTGDEPDVAGQLLRVHEWKLMGVTGVSSPAFETSRVEPVYGEEFTAVRASAALTAAAEQHSGAMVALVPSAEDCARLAIDGYEPADVLHTTLVFLGDAANWSPEQRDALEQALGGVGLAPMTGSVWGHAQLNPKGDSPCAVYLTEAEGITSLQSAALGALEEAGTFDLVPTQHECFVPHITAGYGLEVSKLTEVGPIRYDRIRIAFAGTDVRDIPLEPVTAGLVASSVVYDTADFTMPEPDELTALTVTDDGRVYGHLAQADSCHIGFADVCVSPPTSATGYAYFHQGEISTTEGPLPVGKLTLGTGHAGMRQAARAAAEHYDNTGTAVAVVRCVDGLWGPWLSGRILPGIDDDRIDELRRSGVSGDWRSIQRGSNNLELVAVLAVNVPGFPVPRTRALAASGMRSLIAAGIPPTRKHHVEPEPPITASAIASHVRAELRASAIRESRREAATQRVRAARLAAATRKAGLNNGV